MFDHSWNTICLLPSDHRNRFITWLFTDFVGCLSFVTCGLWRFIMIDDDWSCFILTIHLKLLSWRNSHTELYSTGLSEMRPVLHCLFHRVHCPADMFLLQGVRNGILNTAMSWDEINMDTPWRKVHQFSGEWAVSLPRWHHRFLSAMLNMCSSNFHSKGFMFYLVAFFMYFVTK